MRKWRETDFQFIDSFVRLSSGELCIFLVSVGKGVEVLIQHLGYLICFLTLSEPPNREFCFHVWGSCYSENGYGLLFSEVDWNVYMRVFRAGFASFPLCECGIFPYFYLKLYNWNHWTCNFFSLVTISIMLLSFSLVVIKWYWCIDSMYLYLGFRYEIQGVRLWGSDCTVNHWGC